MKHIYIISYTIIVSAIGGLAGYLIGQIFFAFAMILTLIFQGKPNLASIATLILTSAPIVNACITATWGISQANKKYPQISAKEIKITIATALLISIIIIILVIKIKLLITQTHNESSNYEPTIPTIESIIHDYETENKNFTFNIYIKNMPESEPHTQDRIMYLTISDFGQKIITHTQPLKGKGNYVEKISIPYEKIIQNYHEKIANNTTQSVKYKGDFDVEIGWKSSSIPMSYKKITIPVDFAIKNNEYIINKTPN